MKIFYGICGEGMGHAGRSVALIERLEALGHQVTIFTFADALRLLACSGYAPHRIEGLQFHQRAGGEIDSLRSAGKACRYLWRRRESFDLIRQLALAEQPDLFITDFEPLTAQVARSMRIPCLSVDNQHRFCHPLEGDFPLGLRAYSRLAGEFVRWWIRGPRQCIVAVFHKCPPSRHYQSVDVLLRDRLARTQPSDGDKVLLYGRGGLGRRMAQIAAMVPEQFIAYGYSGNTTANIECKPASYDGFLADLAACKAVICTGGQQLIGEACYFRKPVLVVPIPGQHEQEINARYARKENLGDYCSIGQLSVERITRFLGQRFSGRRVCNGVDQILDMLRVGYG